MSLPTGLKVSLRRNVNLALYTTMQVGGAAEYFAEPISLDELIEAIDFARSEKLPWMILGKGSNMIFPDSGWPGVVISLLQFEKDLIEFDPDAGTVHASAGVHLYRFALACRNAGFGGAEFLSGIPGTFGGALFMNAGFSRHKGQKNEIGDLVESVDVLAPDGSRRTLSKSELVFSYRKSNLQSQVILGGTLCLWKRKPEDVQLEIKANFDYRNHEQDLKHPSSGSIFKNPAPPSPAAGKVIDQLGLKGLRVGGAMVSERHANYIIKSGPAKSSDVSELIQKIQEIVRKETGIELETEVRIIKTP